MVTNNALRRMSKVELVQYALEGDRQARRAADELLRRYERRFRQKGLLDRSRELADPDANGDQPAADEDDRPASLL